MADVTVVLPSGSHALVDLATVKAVLGIAATDTSQDGVLNLYIDEATSVAENYCNRIFAQERLQERWRRRLQFDCERGVYTIYLSRPPIVDIHEIRGPDNQVVPATAYEVIDSDAGLLGLSAYEPYCGWYSWASVPSAAPYRLQIEYTGGFSVPAGGAGIPPLPAAIGRGAIEFVKNVQQSASRASDVTFEKIGDASWRYESQSDLIKAGGSGGGASMGGHLTATVQAVLTPYKLWIAG